MLTETIRGIADKDGLFFFTHKSWICELLIPLAPQVVVWLDELKIRACGNEYVFLARKQSSILHVYHDTLNHAFKALNLPFALAPHDIRRATRTLLAKLGVSDQVAEICLNE